MTDRTSDGEHMHYARRANPLTAAGHSLADDRRRRAPRRNRRGVVVAAGCTVSALLAVGGCGLRISIGTIGAAGPSRAESKLARAVAPRLVDIVSTLAYQDEKSAGTGIVLTSAGEVLTNNHVIEGATTVLVTDVGSGRTYRATVVGYDAADDIAVLRLHRASGLAAMRFGRRPKVTIGEQVIALGNAGGAGGAPAAAAGRVTGLRQSIIATDQSASTSEHLSGLIRTNAGIQPGDSGGPLVSATGQVIGIVTAASSGFLFQGGTEGFAIPIGRALSIARQIEAGRASATVHIGPTGFLGVHLTRARVPGDPSRTGARVASVIPGLPAARAGLAVGDVIVSVAGRAVSSPGGVRVALEPHHPGNAIGVSWVDRAGRAHSATVVLAHGPAG